MSEDQEHNPDESTPPTAGSPPSGNRTPEPDTTEPAFSGDETEAALFEGEDTDAGEAAPDGDELSAEELAAIRESQADPETEPEDAEVG